MRLKIDSANVFGAAEVDRAGEANGERGKMDTFWFLRLGLSLPHLSVLINQPRKERSTECRMALGAGRATGGERVSHPCRGHKPHPTCPPGPHHQGKEHQGSASSS